MFLTPVCLILCFHFLLESLSWSSPICKGTMPSKRSSHKMVAIGDLVYLFGGGGKVQYLMIMISVWTPTPTAWLDKFTDIYSYDPSTFFLEFLY